MLMAWGSLVACQAALATIGVCSLVLGIVHANSNVKTSREIFSHFLHRVAGLRGYCPPQFLDCVNREDSGIFA